MKLTQNLIKLFFVATIPFLLTACSFFELIFSSPQDEKFDCQVSEIKNQNSETKEPNLVKIKIDGTSSMEGFVKVPNSTYIPVLDLIGKSAQNSFTNVTTEYYRFGLTEELLLDKDEEPATKLDFYQYNSNLKDANLNVALTPKKNEDISSQLTIVVTDLYQKNPPEETDIETTLKTQYIQKGYAVGIVPLKSEFDGYVYDVKKPDPYYKGSHPFYLIVVGSYENVAKYFDTLKESDLIKEKDKLIIFSQKFVEKPLTLKIDRQQNLPQGISREYNLNDKNVVMEANQPEITEFLSIKGNPQESLSYTTNDYIATSYSLPISLEIKPDQGQIFDSESKTFTDLDNKNLLKFNNIQFTQENISFQVETDQITTPGVYKLIYKVLPKTGKEPSWWKEWNFEYPSNFDGAKTYNLQPFLQSLNAFTTQEIITEDGNTQENIVGKFCYGIWKQE